MSNNNINDYSDLLIENNLNEDLDIQEDDIDVRFFPSNTYYKRLGKEYVAYKFNLNINDPYMLPLINYIYENLKNPEESWVLNQSKDE